MPKHRFFLWVAIAFPIFIICHGCGASGPEGVWSGSIMEENGITVISNPAEPVFGEISLELEEDLQIGEGGEDKTVFYEPRGLAVDGDGAVFLLDGGNHRVLKFGPDGEYQMTIGQEGQGPGEFDQLRAFFITKSGDVHVIDGMRIQHFGADGGLRDSTPLTNRISDFLLTPEDYLFAVETRNTDTGRRQILLKMDRRGRALEELEEFSDVQAVDQRSEGAVRRIVIVNRYNSRLFMSPAGNGHFIYGFGGEYSLFLRDAAGALHRIIRREAKPMPVSQREKDRVVRDLMENTVVRTRSIPEDVIRQGCQFPANRPFFVSVLVDDLGRIFVERTRSVLEEGDTRILDVFGPEGHYLHRVLLEVPPRLIRAGRIYRLHEDEETGAVTIRRYLVRNWDALRTGLD